MLVILIKNAMHVHYNMRQPEPAQVAPSFACKCRQLVQNILKMNGPLISSDTAHLTATMDESARALAPAEFEDAMVTFEECRYREVNLSPHPAFLCPHVHVLDGPVTSSLRAMPIDETAHHTLIRDGIQRRPSSGNWQASFTHS